MHVEGFEHGETKSQLMKLPTGASEADRLSRALAYIFNTCTNFSPFSLNNLGWVRYCDGLL